MHICITVAVVSYARTLCQREISHLKEELFDSHGCEL